MMDVPYDSDLSFQVMTADGVHVLGTAWIAPQPHMLSGDAWFRANSSYSDSYLNANRCRCLSGSAL